MAVELVHTSATHGLRPGSSGFCTVAATRDLPPSLVPRLEALAGYRPGPSGKGPVSKAFLRLESAGATLVVLARIAPAAPDHTGRSNKLASFLVLGEHELPAAGPAWALAQHGLLRTEWLGEPSFIDLPPVVPESTEPVLRPASAWAAVAGDAGWAGVVASAFLREQQRPVHVVLPESVDSLPLVDEVVALLPAWARWKMTFSTYFMQSVAGAPCCLRICIDGTPAAAAARQSKGLVVDCTRILPPPRESRFVRMARSGVLEDEDIGFRPSPGHAADADPASAAPATDGSALQSRSAPGDQLSSPDADWEEATNEASVRMGPRALALVVVGVMAVIVAGSLAVFRTGPGDSVAGTAAPDAGTGTPSPSTAAPDHDLAPTDPVPDAPAPRGPGSPAESRQAVPSPAPPAVPPAESASAPAQTESPVPAVPPPAPSPPAASRSMERCTLALGHARTVGVARGDLAIRLLRKDGSPVAEGVDFPAEAAAAPPVQGAPGTMVELRRESADRLSILVRRATDAELDAAIGAAVAAIKEIDRRLDSGPAPDLRAALESDRRRATDFNRKSAAVRAGGPVMGGWEVVIRIGDGTDIVRALVEAREAHP